MSERYKSKLVVDILLERENQNKREILLSLRKNTKSYDGMYDLPGGHVEQGEDLVDAMIREAKEEIGITIKREDLEIIHIYHVFQKDVLKFVFKTKKYSDEIINAEPEICGELKWVDIDNIPENTIDGIKKEILNIKNNIFYDEEK